MGNGATTRQRLGGLQGGSPPSKIGTFSKPFFLNSINDNAGNILKNLVLLKIVSINIEVLKAEMYIVVIYLPSLPYHFPSLSLREENQAFPPGLGSRSWSRSRVFLAPWSRSRSRLKKKRGAGAAWKKKSGAGGGAGKN